MRRERARVADEGERLDVLAHPFTIDDQLAALSLLPTKTIALLTGYSWGIGGLGRLAVQFAARMGFHTVAIARGDDKAELARRFGSHHYFDCRAENVAERLTALGGALLLVAGHGYQRQGHERRRRRARRRQAAPARQWRTNS